MYVTLYRCELILQLSANQILSIGGGKIVLANKQFNSRQLKKVLLSSIYTKRTSHDAKKTNQYKRKANRGSKFYEIKSYGTHWTGQSVRLLVYFVSSPPIHVSPGILRYPLVLL